MPKNEKFSLDTPIEEILNNQRRERKEKETVIDARSEASLEHPERNEDSIFQLSKKGAAGVFDGIGGAERGELASQVARDYVANKIDALSADLDKEAVAHALADIIRGADQAVHAKADELSAAEGREIKMGTTAAVVKEMVDDGGRWAIIANAGDSRVYKIKADNSIEQLTVDDGILRIAFGVEREEDPKKKQEKINQVREKQALFNRAGTIEEIKDAGLYMFWSQRNKIFNSLGGADEIKPRILTVPLAEGERIMLASDGLDSVGDNDIEAMLQKGRGAQDIVTMVRSASIDEEKNWRAKPDDTSVIIM